MSLVVDGLAEFIGVLTAANLPVVSDSRNVAPPCVLVDTPSIRSLGVDVAELTIPVVAVAPPPGNVEALNTLLALVDDVLAACTTASASTVTAEPGVYNIGNQELPAYNVRVTVAYRS